jgi:hypothetical protein
MTFFRRSPPPSLQIACRLRFRFVAGLNQRQTATFLGIRPSRLEWAGKGGIIKRHREGFSPCETVTAQWLDYELALHAKRERSAANLNNIAPPFWQNPII